MSDGLLTGWRHAVGSPAAKKLPKNGGLASPATWPQKQSPAPRAPLLHLLPQPGSASAGGVSPHSSYGQLNVFGPRDTLMEGGQITPPVPTHSQAYQTRQQHNFQLPSYARTSDTEIDRQHNIQHAEGSNMVAPSGYLAPTDRQRPMRQVQRQRPWMMNSPEYPGAIGAAGEAGAGFTAGVNSRGSHGWARNSWTNYDGDMSALSDPMNHVRLRAGRALGGATGPSHSPITGYQSRLLAARGQDYGPDPRYRADPPGARLTPPSMDVDENGNRTIGGNGFPRFTAGQPYYAKPTSDLTARHVNVSNSPTGGLSLVGEGPLPELTADQIAKQAAAKVRYAKNSQELRDNRVMLAKKMYGLDDSVPAVARAMSRRLDSPEAKFQHALANFDDNVKASQESNAKAREAWQQFVIDHGDKLSDDLLGKAKKFFESQMVPDAIRPTLNDFTADPRLQQMLAAPTSPTEKKPMLNVAPNEEWFRGKKSTYTPPKSGARKAMYDAGDRFGTFGRGK